MGLRVLLVEDDKNKLADIRGFLDQTYPEAVVTDAASYQSALKCLRSNSFDLVLLDMTIPTFDKVGDDFPGRLRPLGGRDLLGQMVRRDIAARVIVVTGYDVLGEGDSAVSLSKLSTDLEHEFPRWFLGVVSYSRAEDRWRKDLARLVDIARAGVGS